MTDNQTARDFHYYYRRLILSIGLLIPVSFNIYSHIAYYSDEPILELIGFILLAFVPYLILFAISFKARNIYSLLLTAIFFIVLDVYANLSVHVFPESSTAGLISVFLPIYQIILVIPAGFLSGFIIKKCVIAIRKKLAHEDVHQPLNDS